MIPVIMRNDPSLAVRTLVVSSGSTVGGRSNEVAKVDTWGMMAWRLGVIFFLRHGHS